MAIFQAYCFDKDHDGNSFLLTFPEFTVADEWWRAISDTPAVASLFTRASPQFYTHTASVLNVSDFFTDSRTKNIASKFEGRIHMKKMDDKNGGFPILQSSSVADVVDETWVYIRSVAIPHIYWYYNDQPDFEMKPITVSETSRTRFLISSYDNQVPAGKVFTNNDRILLQIEGTKGPMYVGARPARITGPVIVEVRTSNNFAFWVMQRIRKQVFVLPDGFLGYNNSVTEKMLVNMRSVWEFVQ